MANGGPFRHMSAGIAEKFFAFLAAFLSYSQETAKKDSKMKTDNKNEVNFFLIFWIKKFYKYIFYNFLKKIFYLFLIHYIYYMLIHSSLYDVVIHYIFYQLSNYVIYLFHNLHNNIYYLVFLIHQ